MAAKSPALIIDTSFWVSLYQPKDVLHQQAIKLNQSGALNHSQITITNYILLETITVLSLHAGKAAAQDAARHLTNPHRIHCLQITELLDRHALKMLFSYPSKNLSFVDASLIAVLKAHPTTQLLSFDQQLCNLARHLSLNVLPNPLHDPGS